MLRYWAASLASVAMLASALGSSPEAADRARKVVLRADLSGDGRSDTAVVTFTPDGNYFRVFVGRDSLVQFGESLDDTASIVDIDTTDRFREIAIHESGPSDDDAVYFVRYSHEGLRILGRVPGFMEDLRVDGSGTVRTSCRGRILHTWFYPCSFRASKETGTLWEVPQAFKPMNAKVRLKRALPLFPSPVQRKVAAWIDQGEDATIEVTDDVQWCRIRSRTGVSGWFWFRDGRIAIGSEDVDALEVFDGLMMAD